MELIEHGNKLLMWIKKFKYAALVVLIGLILMMIPQYTGGKEKRSPVEQEIHDSQTVEERLCDILGKIRGAGEVHVMLLEAQGEETVYQTDTEINEKSEDASKRYNTVTVTDSDRNETGLIKYKNPPKYTGVIVVCDGADDPSVRLAITEAISKLTGLGTDHISVLRTN